MPNRLAAVLSLIVFAVCLLIGGLQADNPFATAVGRALVAMFGTFVIGLILGHVAQRMLSENLRAEEQNMRKTTAEVREDDR